jgi:hypothetical protein
VKALLTPDRKINLTLEKPVGPIRLEGGATIDPRTGRVTGPMFGIKLDF